tara:strand:+ start:3623 stop:3931 length:309 start_codon:yes stop_codon:yes gene_type:complete
MKREDVLRNAEELTSAVRDEIYGDPTTNHERIAEMWSSILNVDVRAEEVVLCMIAVKMSRLCRTPHHEDSWVDIAGYAALGGEIADNFFNAVDDMKDVDDEQ